MEVLAISRDGLRRRACAGKKDADETSYLEPLEEIAKSGESMGEYTAKMFAGELNGDAKRLF